MLLVDYHQHTQYNTGMSEISKRGGTITSAQIDEYRKKKTDYIELSIRMYSDYHNSHDTLEVIRERYGFKSTEAVRKRINQLIGEINKL